MIKIGIYKITSPSGRVYIGQSNNINRRFKRYKSLDCKTQIRLHRSFIKHGIENHIFEILEECFFENLNIRERYWQDFYNVIGENGLNCTLINTQELPKVCSFETKIKIGNAKRGSKNVHFGKPKSEEWKKEHGDKIRGKYAGDKHYMFNKKADLNQFSKLVIDLQTGIFYYCVREAAEAFNIKHSTLAMYLCGLRKNKTSLIYI